MAGSIVLFGGLALMFRAQLDLGASWRVGIDEGAGPGLVKGGLYRLSRNPIFLAMLTVLVGLALLIPNVISLVAGAGTAIGIRQ
jgi:protein-S-isoprenylcysteine O-methyltransferase Ste14